VPTQPTARDNPGRSGYPRSARGLAARGVAGLIGSALTACAPTQAPAPPPSTPAAAAASATASSDAPVARSPERSAALTVTSRLSAQAYRCNLVIGLPATAAWFDAGFEELVDDARWQALLRPHTFVEDWADPGNLAWSEPLRSPCLERATEPERVLFFAADWRYKDESDWITGLTAAVNALRAHYPSAREIQLLSVLRAPGNVSCGDAKSVVEPFVDRAIAAISARFEKLVRVGPRFEVPACDAFEKGGPELSVAGKKLVARLLAEHYAAEL
jgi:hypothetical protein